MTTCKCGKKLEGVIEHSQHICPETVVNHTAGQRASKKDIERNFGEFSPTTGLSVLMEGLKKYIDEAKAKKIKWKIRKS